MKIIFFGSSKFAAPSLSALVKSSHEILCVVTQPDREKGRGLNLQPTAVKQEAVKSGLNIYQPLSANSPEALEYLKKMNADLFLVISYGQILSQSLLDLPRLLPINAHASLLPKYRGAAPINWAIIKGEKSSGVTVIKMVKEMDAGPILSQEEIPIDYEDTSLSLEEKLSNLSAELVLRTIKNIEHNDYRLLPQDKNKLTFAPKLKKRDGLIDWGKGAAEINNLICGCQPWPGAYSYYGARLLKIYKAVTRESQIHKGAKSPGEIIEVSAEGIIVSTGKDILMIKELQIEGKRKMPIEEFISGNKICVGETLGKQPAN